MEVNMFSFPIHSSAVPNKPYGFCGRKAPRQKEQGKKKRKRKKKKKQNKNKNKKESSDVSIGQILGETMTRAKK